MEHDKSVFNSVLDHFIRYLNNDQLQCILQRTRASDWICDDGTTLLHLAVMHNNHELIEYLLDAGYNVNAKKSSGDTPLLIALRKMNFEAVKLLVNANADVCIVDKTTGQTALRKLVHELQINLYPETKKLVEDLMPRIMIVNLKTCNLDTERLVELLVESQCPFEYVYMMKDTAVNRELLKRNPPGDYEMVVKCVMAQRDFETIQLILRHGDVYGRWQFYLTLTHYFINNHMELWKAYIERLPHWDVICKDGIRNLDVMFSASNMDRLQILLDSKIDVQVREKFGVDFRASLFMNDRIDAIGLLENKIYSGEFDVNASSVDRLSGLHAASTNNLVTNVEFLLDLGVDVNRKNEKGRTALFECIEWNSIHSGRLLLENGADVQVIDKYGKTVFQLRHLFFPDENSLLLEFLIAQLAIDRVQGVEIKQTIKDQIDANEEYTIIYETCCQQLEVLKTCKIVGSITLYTLLTEEIETLYRFLRDQDFISLLDEYKCKHNFHLHYYSSLTTKFTKISNLYLFKGKIADIISENTGKFVDFDHLVVRNICQYLTRKDIYAFMKMF